MTDRIHSLTAVLAENVRADDAEPIINAIKMIKGVQVVTLHVTDPTTHMAESRAKEKMLRKLLDVYNDLSRGI